MAGLIIAPRARIFHGHDWVYATEVKKVFGDPLPGDVITLKDFRDRPMGTAIYNPQSQIIARRFSRRRQDLDLEFFTRRIQQAVTYRESMPFDSTLCRIVWSESDGIPGLIVDRYGDYLAVQVTALAIATRLETICDALTTALAPKGILLRGAERGLAKLEGLAMPDRVIRGTAPTGPIFVQEHGLKFGVDLAEGQKTGYYLDQRDNRQAAARHARGRRVLDMFCYSGGFAVACAVSGGARSVLAVDASDKAAALARANADLNGAANVAVEAMDAFEKLDSLAAAGERFGMIVLDPPKFARSRATVDDALRAYHRINRVAVGLLEPGGILVTCSCSGSVTRDDFHQMLSGVAQRSGRSIQILESRGAAADHPVNASCLEGEYLTCVIARVA
jgi:23S rRNA (cytosine1962-C5)-methyltransferase